MSGLETAFFVLVFGAFALLVLAGIIKYLTDFFNELRPIKMELMRAQSPKEQKYWSERLFCYRLSIIPGLSPDRARRILRFICKKKDLGGRSDGLMSLIMPSIVGILISAVCLAGGTWAWFTSSQTAQSGEIRAADYDIRAAIFDASGVSLPEASEYDLGAGDYTLVLKATGDATRGYCVIKLDGYTVHTTDIKPGEVLTLTLHLNAPARLLLVPQWGSSAKPAEERASETVTYTPAAAETGGAET